ncbi:MAG TPA: cystathionine beta-lyase [Stellaceae bacterium]|nr:cystathionine beta-lyase [Stellaceae bacterium]
MKPETQITQAGRDPHGNHGIVNPPIYHVSTILQPSLAALDEAAKPGYPGYTYGRRGTPTSRALESAVAGLYGAEESVAVSSGLAAVTVALMSMTRAGDHILVTDSAYFPTRQFCDGMARYGVETTYYDPLIGGGIAALIRPNTRLIYVESPGSQTFEVQDVPAIAAAAHGAGAQVVMDNTWATALNFPALERGVDLVVESATKYICGHSDIMMGVVVGNGAPIVAARAMAGLLGNCCGGDDLYLAQRGLRTLAVRIERNQANALALALWLRDRPEVSRVLHPGLPEDPGHALWRRDFTGASGLFGFMLKPGPRSALAAFLDGLKFYGMGFSWGGYESLILPNNPATARTATDWTEPGTLLRIHAGLENIDDLIADLAAGFERWHAACAA